MALKVPYHKPSIGREEIDEVVKTLESGWLTSGPRTAQFEQEFREYVHAPHALAVNSCTAGLHLALAALNIGPGDEVITTPLTFCATVNVIQHVGATPVLADVGPDGNIDPESVASRINGKTRAIIPVHLAGLPVNMNAIWALAKKHQLYVIEDCAHAIGSFYQGFPIGAGNPDLGYFSDACAYSFYATKNLTTGEGGMVTTHKEDLANSLKRLCLHGISKDAWNRYSDKGNWFYEVVESGFKYNMSDLQSGVGIHQLRKIEQFTDTRTRYAHMYNEILSDVEELERPPDSTESRHAWHLYTIRLNLDKLNISRADFITQMRDEKSIGTSVHFIPIQLHPFFGKHAHLPENQCPKSLALYERLVSLPLYPAMTEADVEYVANSVKQLARAARKTLVSVGGGN